ncbi:MAG: type II secretion system protein [Pseudomonadota bacterium]
MIKQAGFTLVELVLFIILTSILAATILLGLRAYLSQVPNVHNAYIAVVTARQCMEGILDEKAQFGFSFITCPSTTVPSFCTAPSGFSIAVDFTCTTLSTDTNYQTIAVTVAGAGSATLTSLIGLY